MSRSKVQRLPVTNRPLGRAEIAAVPYQPRVVSTTAGLIAAMRERRKTLGLRHLDVDDLAGLADGHTSKIEGYDRKWGRRVFKMTTACDYLLQALGLAIVVMPREEALRIADGVYNRETTVRGEDGAEGAKDEVVNLCLRFRKTA